MCYGELERTTTEIADALTELGLSPGQRMAVHWSNSIETVQLFLAGFKAGVVVVPVNTRLQAPEIAFVLSDSGASVCFSEPELAPLAREAACACGLPDVYTSLPLATRRGTTNSPSFSVADDSACIILYTSGTTSANPKGVVHTHRSVAAAVTSVAAYWGDSIETTTVMTSLMHVVGPLISLLPALSKGATSVLVPRFEASVVLDTIERFGCTNFISLPWMADSLVIEQIARPHKVRSLRKCATAGDVVSHDLQKRFAESFGLPLLEAFGMTEIGGAAANSPAENRPGSFGKPLSGFSLRVVDSSGNDLPTGETGELIVRSKATCSGYWNNPEATNEALHDGWFYTGDLARQDEDSYFWFAGRKKDLIVRMGYKVTPFEVEQVLKAHKSVAEAGVVGLPDPSFGERVIALIKPKNKSEFNELELLEFAGQSLADYKTPERILLFPELPKNANGKVDRPALKNLAATLLEGSELEDV